MAAYHFTSKIHTRAKGASAVRAAAYRAAERMYDDRAGKVEDYTRKADVVESAILAPENAPGWVQDRAALWNRVEAREKRRDAQVAQEFEINLPRELSDAQNWNLITDFVREHLVSVGRVCDIAMHVGEASDGNTHPHAHILMPLRELSGDGFGEKHPDCDWRTFLNRRDRLGELREIWCDYARQRALELGIDLGPDWDHRSLADRGIDLEPQPKIGATAQRLEAENTSADRTSEFLETQRRNGARLLNNPSIALDAMTSRQSTFTEADLARWVHRHSADDQFAAIMDIARSRLVPVGIDDRGCLRFSTREMIETERQMVHDAGEIEARHQHHVNADKFENILAGSMLSDEQKNAARHLVHQGDLACLVGFAGAGKSTMLAAACRAWEEDGFTVRGVALSGIAAQNLADGSGVDGRTLASLTYAWENDRDALTARDIIIVDEAGMIGSKDLAQLIDRAKIAGAKIVLVGDPEQLQAIEAGAAFRAIAERVGAAELTEVRRQQIDWQRDATRELATGKTAEALTRYRETDAVQAELTDANAKQCVVDHWYKACADAPEKSRIMLAHTRADVHALNQTARQKLRDDNALGDDIAVETTRGRRDFATGDRLLFLRNERSMEVRNGTLATIERMDGKQITVRTDDERIITFDSDTYRDIDHGYAVTTHKAQGVTVDETYVYASGGFDRHLTYVALSRHREKMQLVFSRETFGSDDNLARVLGRERAKDTTLDYLEPATPEMRAIEEMEKRLSALRNAEHMQLAYRMPDLSL